MDTPDRTPAAPDAAATASQVTELSEEALGQISGGAHDLAELNSLYGSTDAWVVSPE